MKPSYKFLTPAEGRRLMSAMLKQESMSNQNNVQPCAFCGAAKIHQTKSPPTGANELYEAFKSSKTENADLQAGIDAAYRRVDQLESAPKPKPWFVFALGFVVGIVFIILVSL